MYVCKYTFTAQTHIHTYAGAAKQICSRNGAQWRDASVEILRAICWIYCNNNKNKRMSKSIPNLFIPLQLVALFKSLQIMPTYATPLSMVPCFITIALSWATILHCPRASVCAKANKLKEYLTQRQLCTAVHWIKWQNEMWNVLLIENIRALFLSVDIQINIIA